MTGFIFALISFFYVAGLFFVLWTFYLAAQDLWRECKVRIARWRIRRDERLYAKRVMREEFSEMR